MKSIPHFEQAAALQAHFDNRQGPLLASCCNRTHIDMSSMLSGFEQERQNCAGSVTGCAAEACNMVNKHG